MATLNTLRTKGGWIVTIVIGLALLAFLVGDLAGRNSIFGIKEKVGKIDGTSVSYIEYAQKVESLTEINKLLSRNESLTSEQQDQIRNYAWEEMINEVTIYPGLEALGIQVTEDEMFDRIYGNNISSVLLNFGFFNDEKGTFSKTALQNFVNSLDADRSGNSRRIWQYIKDQVYQEALMSKYYALVSNMPYVTDAEAAAGTTRANTIYNARYIAQGYDLIPDSTVTVSSSDVRKYYDAHKDQFKQVASRNLEYVVFDVIPSAADYADAKAYVNELAAEFATATDLQQYITLNSHEQFDATYYTPEQMPAALAAYAFNADREAIYGPVLENNTYTTTRVADVRSFPDTLGIRQMAFMPGTEKLADSVFNVLKNGGDFMALSAEYSALPAESADMGHFPTQYIPMEMIDAIQATREKLVKFQAPNGGIFVLDVYYRGPESRKAQLANLVYHIEPSAATQQAAYQKASGFYTATAGVRANFDKIAADSVYSKRVATVYAGQTAVSGLADSREMVRWSFNNKPGSISNIMEIDDNYVVAVLTSASNFGYTPVEQVSTQIASILRQEKKADMLAAKMQGSSLDALAQSLSAEVKQLEDFGYTGFYVPEIGFEPALIGAVSGGVAEGQVSKPVKGMNGVYVAEITSKQVSDATTQEMERARLQAQDETSLMQRAAGAMIQKAEVQDDRSMYF